MPDNNLLNPLKYRSEVAAPDVFRYQDYDANMLSFQRWAGEWSSARLPYVRSEEVLDDGWLMVSLESDNYDKAAPVPTGDPYWVIDLVGTPNFVEEQHTAPALYYGQRYTIGSDGYINKIRFWLASTSVGTNVEVWSVSNPTTTPDYQVILPNFTVEADDVDQWIEVPVGQIPVAPGASFDLVIIQRPATGENTFSWEWDYKQKNGDPPSGEINHQSGGNQDEMRVHQEDQTGTNRSTDLDNIGPGSTITMQSNGTQWEVLSASKTGAVYTFIVDPATRAQEDTSFFTFVYYDALPMDIERDQDFFLGSTSVQSLFSTTSYADAVIADDAFGLDIEVQAMQKSEKWDIKQYPGGGGGGGSSTPADPVTLAHGAVRGVTGPSPLSAAWDTLKPFDTQLYTPVGVTFDLVNGTFSFAAAGQYEIHVSLAFRHNVSGINRHFRARLFNQTDATGEQSQLWHVGGSDDASNGRFTLIVDVPSDDIGDLWRVEIGNGTDFIVTSWETIQVAIRQLG